MGKHIDKDKAIALVEMAPSKADAMAALLRMDPADVVPVRRGRWIPKFNGNFKGGAYWYECSECRHIVPGGLQSGKMFCENCGARMDGNT